MGQPLYPRTVDLQAFLGSAGLSLADDQVEIAVLAGIEMFEQKVDRHMLAGYTTENVAVLPETRVFAVPENPHGYVPFDADLPAPPTIVALHPQDADAEPLTELTDYILLPQNAPQGRRPYQALQLKRRYHSPQGWRHGSAVEVTGSWGFRDNIPEDAWQAMINLATVRLLDMHLINITGLSLGWKEADVSVDYGVEPGKQRIAGLQMQVDTAVGRYRKVYL